MVLVQGRGVLGMQGQPYGIVPHGPRPPEQRPEEGCPAAISASPGAVTCWVQTDEVDPVLPPRPVELAPFCVDAWPFPGPGVPYSQDGLGPAGVGALQRLLAGADHGGRRLCGFSEWQAAVAGLQGNRRFLYGDDAPGARCGSDSLEVAPIGADPACRSPETGLYDYGAVLSHWVLADPAFLAFACTEAGGGCKGAGGRTLRAGDPLVAGGTRRVMTRQAPLTPHTWHDHGPASSGGACTDPLMWDDQPMICADPDPGWQQQPLPEALARGQETWLRLLVIAREEGRMAAVMEAGLGPGWCPGA